MKSYGKSVVLTIIIVMLLAPVLVFAGGQNEAAEPVEPVVETEVESE